MKLTHSFTVPTPVDQAWTAFNDLERVVPCFPGATLTSSDENGFAGSCKVKLGPIALVYNGTGRFVSREDHRLVVEANGRDRRGNGTAKALVTAELAAAGDGTAVTVDTDLTVTGKPAQFGRGVIQDVSDRLLTQFVDCLRTELGTLPTAGTASEGSAPDGSSLDLGSTMVRVIGRRVLAWIRRILRR